MYRFCVDFRYTIPNVDELTESFTQHIPNFISSMNLSSVFFSNAHFALVYQVYSLLSILVLLHFTYL